MNPGSRLLGLVVVGLAVIGGVNLLSGANAEGSFFVGSPAHSLLTTPQDPAPVQLLQPAPTTQRVLTVEDVAGWCIAGACDPARLEQTVEGTGIVNSQSVHWRTGQPASFQIPAGVWVQSWDCFNYSEVTGPATISQLCEGTFRLS